MGMFSVPMNVQIFALRASWSMQLFGSHRASTLASQLATYDPNSRVATYSCIEDITKATSTLKWTSDPWDGKLDVIKHPTFMQQAINQHPDYSGDCDDYANYWVAALTINKLADEVYFGCTMWLDGNKIQGHACCVFRTKDQWWWVSNWHDCVPQKIEKHDGWVDGMINEMKKPFVVAGKYYLDRVGVWGSACDTVVYGAAVKIR